MPDSPKPQRRSWTEDDEKTFVAQLEAELDKVFTFQRVKSEEIVRRIKSSETEVNEVIARLDSGEAGGRAQNDNLEGVKEGTPSDEDFLLLEEDLSDIIADVHDLAKFTQLNYTGFQKIIKKHDVSSTKGPWTDLKAERILETNIMAPQASVCHKTESQAFL